MKGNVFRIARIAAVLSMLALLLAGCGAKTGGTREDYADNFRFVPRIHVEENSFGVTSGSEYRGCSYDNYYDGYWCPVNR